MIVKVFHSGGIVTKDDLKRMQDEIVSAVHSAMYGTLRPAKGDPREWQRESERVADIRARLESYSKRGSF